MTARIFDGFNEIYQYMHHVYNIDFLIEDADCMIQMHQVVFPVDGQLIIGFVA